MNTNNNIQDEDVIDYNEDVDEAPAASSSSATLPQSDPDHAKHAEDVQLRAPPSTSTSAKKQQVDTAVDRLSSCPFLIRVFVKNGSHHALDSFTSWPKEDEVLVHTWKDATLNELVHLVSSLHPLFSRPATGRSLRISIRSIYTPPNPTRGAGGRRMNTGTTSSVTAMKSRDLGVVVSGAGGSGGGGARCDGERMLEEVRFVQGDCLDICVTGTGAGEGIVGRSSNSNNYNSTITSNNRRPSSSSSDRFHPYGGGGGGGGGGFNIRGRADPTRLRSSNGSSDFQSRRGSGGMVGGWGVSREDDKSRRRRGSGAASGIANGDVDSTEVFVGGGFRSDLL